MNREDIIAMARGSEWLGKYESSTGFSAECAVKFAALVASAEREACAKVCDLMAVRYEDMRGAALESAAESIRLRGQA
jgi:hypothetical protein